uniref:RNase III domain-containing protein n=1 Tax=Solanum lycopersicum TaxID=4081 RepID=K4AU81_SOLLC
MTTKKCLQNFHLESLKKLGKSFLRYAISIQSFKTYENYHEGLLNIKKNKIIFNVALFKLGYVPTSARTGNVAALLFMKWNGMDIDFIYAPILRHFIVNAKNLLNVRLHEHILHSSPDLQRQICYTFENFEKLDIVSTFGWESATTHPIVVGDVVGPLLVRSLLILALKKILNTFLNIRPLLVCASPSFGEINTT